MKGERNSLANGRFDFRFSFFFLFNVLVLVQSLSFGLPLALLRGLGVATSTTTAGPPDEGFITQFDNYQKRGQMIISNPQHPTPLRMQYQDGKTSAPHHSAFSFHRPFCFSHTFSMYSLHISSDFSVDTCPRRPDASALQCSLPFLHYSLSSSHHFLPRSHRPSSDFSVATSPR